VKNTNLFCAERRWPIVVGGSDGIFGPSSANRHLLFRSHRRRCRYRHRRRR